MRRPIASLFVLALMWLVIASALPAGAQEDVVPNELLIKLNTTASPMTQGRILLSMGLAPLRWIDRASVFVVAVPSGWTLEQMLGTLASDSRVLYVEPNAVFRASANDDIPQPNDLYFGMQWNLWNAETGINVLPAWTVSKGRGIPVAVLDTGCAFSDIWPYQVAPDLSPSRIIPLSDWVNRDASPDDDNGHGTFICGIIGQDINNELATVGVAPECLLLPSKVLDATGVGRADWVAGAIYEAVVRGARIILIGANSRFHSRTVQDAVNHAVARGVLVVCPAGNDGVNLDHQPGAAAIYANSLVVASTNSRGRLSSFSNYGSAVSFVAPGGDFTDLIWAQTFDPSVLGTPYGFRPNSVTGRTGTCIAAAHVAGVLALALAVERSLNDVIQSARDLGATGRDPLYGYGLPNAAGAVGSSASSPAPGSVPDSPYDVAVLAIQPPSGPVQAGSTVNVVVRAANLGEFFDEFKVRLSDTATGVTVGERTVSLDSGAQTDVTFPWFVQGGSGIHRLRAEAIALNLPEKDVFNNQVALDVEVRAAPFMVQVQTYAPSFEDPSQGVPQDSFRGGSYIGIGVNVVDNGAPAVGATVHLVLRGALGADIYNGYLTTGADGRVTIQLLRYTGIGGYGTYTVEATATLNGKSSTQVKTFEVYGRTISLF